MKYILVESKVKSLLGNLQKVESELEELKLRNDQINKEIEEITLKLPLQMVPFLFFFLKFFLFKLIVFIEKWNSIGASTNR